MDRRLAPSRMRADPRRLGALRARTPLCDAGAGAAGGAARAAAPDLAGQPLRRGHGNPDHRTRPGARLRGEPEALRRGVQPGQLPVRDPARDRQGSGAAPAALRVFLLDGLGGRRLSPRRHRLIHEQLAPRAADRQRSDAGGRGVDRGEHPLATGRHRLHCLVLRGDARAPPARDPLVGLSATPSQRATMKYFVVVAALFLVQIVAGAVVAHYGVEGDGLYGIPLSRLLPYSLTRTWHVQLGLFWIATSWLAAGLFIGPLVSGVEPKGQRLGVNVLFGALVAVVVGSLAGESLSIHGWLSDAASFYWGHQGWEYLDLGRVWQSGLFLGLLLWLVLMLRVIWPVLADRGERRTLVLMFALSAGAIALFYGAGLMYGRQTHISMVEYWRWWVVHLWVEGFFEVFATTVIAFLFARLGLVSVGLAAQASLLAATLYLAGGIVGTNHHLYFAGTPTAALAWGATLSALEVVPLVLIGYQAMKDWQISRRTAWARKYRWPVYFFIAVGFWILVGAGLFGFMINPPIALFYMQGLTTTPVHAHADSFGVYGMLGLGLTLMCLRALQADREWKEGLLRFSFWAMNGGLMAMIVLSLLPVGLLQTVASVKHGYWYARSHEFLGQGLMQTLRWLRMPGDTLFAIGAMGFVVFIFGLGFGYSLKDTGRPEAMAMDRSV